MNNSNLAFSYKSNIWDLPEWNYQTIKNKLIWEINKIEVPNFDWIFTKAPLNLW